MPFQGLSGLDCYSSLGRGLLCVLYQEEEEQSGTLGAEKVNFLYCESVTCDIKYQQLAV